MFLPFWVGKQLFSRSSQWIYFVIIFGEGAFWHFEILNWVRTNFLNGGAAPGCRALRPLTEPDTFQLLSHDLLQWPAQYCLVQKVCMKVNKFFKWCHKQQEDVMPSREDDIKHNTLHLLQWLFQCCPNQHWIFKMCPSSLGLITIRCHFSHVVIIFQQ